MSAGHRVRTVASFEFLCAVRRKSYLITTFGMPLFIAVYGGVLAIPGYFEAKKRAEVKIYGVVDRPGLLRLDREVRTAGAEIPGEIREALEAAGQAEVLDRGMAWRGALVFRPFDLEDDARAALLDGDVRGYFLLDEDYLATGTVDSFFTEGLNLEVKEIRRPFEKLLLSRLVEGRLPEDVASRVSEPIGNWKEWALSPTGERTERSPFAVFARLIIPLVFAILLVVSLLMSAGGLIQATSAEKENKVVEVLLSSARPDEILAGKLLGLGAAGLIQVFVWFSMIVAGTLAVVTAMTLAGIEVPWQLLPLGLVFFVAAYLFIGSLMLGTGSLGTNQRESQQLGMIWTLPVVFPLVMLGAVLQEPHGTVGRILTWIPFTAPVTVILRTAIEPAGMAWWEMVGPLVVMGLATWVTVGIGARLFRVGLLLTGSRPKLRDILRQARLSG